MAGDGKEHPRMIFQPRLKFHPSNTASETQPWSPLRYYAMHSIVGFLINSNMHSISRYPGYPVPDNFVQDTSSLATPEGSYNCIAYGTTGYPGTGTR